jgi:hypothetical protein
VFGDAAGSSPHSNVGQSDYEILEKKLKGIRVDWNQMTANPPVKDTLNAVRARVCSAAGAVHLFIHPRCRTLIKDLKTATWPDGSNRLRQFHCLAALRYYLYALFGDVSGGYDTGGPVQPNLGGRRKVA